MKTPEYDAINKSQLIQNIASRCDFISDAEVDTAVRMVIDLMSDTLESDSRIEVRGFGTFSLHYRKSRQGRNPKTGESVFVPAKAIPHFKPGKALRDDVNDSI